MLTNIIDRRKRPYRFAKINAVIEPTRNDNSIKDADKAPPKPRLRKSWLGYDEKEHVTVREAVLWGVLHDDYVTLYLYDKDSGIYEIKRASRKGSGGGVLARSGQPSRPGRRSKKSAHSLIGR